MKKLSFLLTSILILLTACSKSTGNQNAAIEKITGFIKTGNLKSAISLVDSLKRVTVNEKVLWKADSLRQIAERIPLDFSLSKDEVVERLQKRSGNKFNPEDIKKWEEIGWIEYFTIDGEKKYFNRAASNLDTIRNFFLNRAENDSSAAHDPELVFRRNHTERIMKASSVNSTPSEPIKIVVIYTLTVHPDVAPAGETIRCWLPYPKENSPRQKDVYLLGVSDENFILAPDSAIHRSIYMEKKVESGKPAIFKISYSYTSSGQYFDPSSLEIKPYNKNTELYKKYTSEQLPQICFTKNVRDLADSITGKETNPFEMVRKIYYWFSNNIPWTGAQEYSIMPNIPEYVIRNKHGDCGMQTFLFMSLLRYKGVPVRWQSGWNMQPGYKNLHDWCEVYFEGTGWVPVDVEHKPQYTANLKTKEFYISGIDSYRLIVNDGVSGIFYPPKKSLRSEPYDFQRGEVEWKGGNLYFDKWDYNMTIEYK